MDEWEWKHESEDMDEWEWKHESEDIGEWEWKHEIIFFTSLVQAHHF